MHGEGEFSLWISALAGKTDFTEHSFCIADEVSRKGK